MCSIRRNHSGLIVLSAIRKTLAESLRLVQRSLSHNTTAIIARVCLNVSDGNKKKKCKRFKFI
ncbi:hypothetical protein JOC94_004056 [Bacillus thermophilus]|uniref:Uncharacterized protein n=1 Tax=Siminovitchia thermophila TaxID=1245522 RepID=A0ABS2RBJ9_9BACI|nr:hypothetical protein [Siminovitchia thermophila]